MYEDGSIDRCSILVVLSSSKSNITYSNTSPQSHVEYFMVTDSEYIVSTSLFMDHYTRQMPTRVLGSSPDLQDWSSLLHHFKMLLYMLMAPH